ncbi:MAG TPA: lipopolysaccharide heptosyltransferase II [Candidatus Omnitrophica bacterium]|nr:lipopolysaccharide heptosyltransferase II [Candidatus Omnitrophota bacterium]
MKILVVNPSSLGDIIHALPTVRILRRAFPQADIAWLINENFAPILDGCPVISRVIPFARHRYTTPHGIAELGRLIAALHRERFDWAIDLQCLLRSSLITLATGARRRTGLSDGREGSTSFYNELIKVPAPHMHAVDRYLMLPRQLGIQVDRVDFPLAPDPRGAKAGPEKLILVNPGARWPTKRWPAPRFGELLARLAALWPDHRLAIIGSPDERITAEAIAAAAHAPVEMLAGRTTLPQLVDLMRRAALLISNDSGPMHLAVAVGTPVVAIFGPTNPRQTGPYPGAAHAVLRVSLPCSPCLKAQCKDTPEVNCLIQIEVEQVVAAAERLMRKT